MYYMGIDPGKSGAYALLGREDGPEVYVWDEDKFIQFMSGVDAGKTIVCLEHVGAMPGQGVTSMFSFGENFGFIQGVLKSFGVPYELVRPKKWKKEFSITGEKNRDIEVCKRLFPDISLRRTERCKKDHDGFADALLMAEYARRRL